MRLCKSQAALVILVASGVAMGTLAALVTPGCGSSSKPPSGGDGGVPPASSPDERWTAIPVCRAPQRPSSATAVVLKDVFPNLPALSSPVGFTQAPGDADHFYIWQQSGQVLRIAASDPTATETVLDLSATANKIVSGGEAGLLGLAFSPKWQTDHTAYLSYTTPSGAPAGFDSKIARIKSSDGGATFAIGTEELVLQFAQPFTNHNGGNILFGPDGFLYAGFGDGGSGNDPQNNGQSLTTFLGKMLRLDVDGQTTYAIPPKNPFAQDTTGKKKEIYAYGVRNPWRWSFDRGTGDLWVGDVGQNEWEEIDKVELGGNYGWNQCEGFHSFSGATASNPNNPPCTFPGALPPVVEYGHANTTETEPGVSVTGGYVYRGKGVPSLEGSYLFADYGSGRLWRIVYDAAGKGKKELLLETGKNISSFGEGLDGEIYVVVISNGRIYKLVTGPIMPGTNFPQVLSATGCVDPQAPSVPSPGLIPYDVNVPLWSDGADKRRWLSLPPTGQIHINADGDWDLPIGTILVKEFADGARRIETRLLVRHDDGEWAGYSYEWLDDQTDAVLLPSSKTKDLGGGRSWFFPSRNDCLQCHTQAAGRTLGLETAQMNRESPDGSGNQLAVLEAIGAFDAPLPPPPATLPALAHIDDVNAPLADRARGYLHANCSFCHRMNGPGRVPPDWRYSNTLMQTGACDTIPADGDLGVAGAKVIVPGMPASSVVSLRMKALDAARMPPLASHVVDPDGTALIDAWLTSLTSCN
ncbi:MAG: hypothetical protein JWN44_4256 [Myxococcales bacterium]|nr:hypothetical protein [Myxococcales bacterium]